MIGETISHYRILEELGRGGMGVVYKAKDTRLQRFVAIKVLPSHLITDEESKARLIREAGAASALEHPGICHIHEIDETAEGHLFMVMPCYEGETLEDRLKRDTIETGEAIDIAMQVASALGAAHEKGIIHRDIKPGNVMLTGGGRQVKLMDFGLVKRLDATKLTRTGTALGTIAYMSPEQALGKEADHRADIWALGVILYEMISGRKPFQSEFEPGMVYSIVNEDPEPVAVLRRDVPPGVDRIIERALDKDTGKRYQDVGEMLSDLEEQKSRIELGVRQRRFVRMRRKTRNRILRIGLPAAAVAAGAFVLFVIRPYDLEFRAQTKQVIAQKNSMAIMTFNNLADPTDEKRMSKISKNLLITGLGESEYIRVLPEQRQYDILKDMGRKPGGTLDWSDQQEVARRANINWIVTAKILTLEPQFLLTSEIKNAVTGDIRSTQRVVGRPGEEIYEVIDRLVGGIRDDLDLPMEAGDESVFPVAEITTRSIEAYNYYLTGMEQYYQYQWDRAIASFDKAIEHDSTFAQAYFRKAMARMTLGDPVTNEEWSRAVQHLDKVPRMEKQFIGIAAAEKLDLAGFESLAESFPEEKELQYWLGVIYFHRLRQVDRAIEYFERALELDPNYTMALMDINAPYLQAGRFEDALWAVNQSKRLTPDNPLPYYTSAVTYGLMGDMDKAIEGCEKTLELDPDFTFAHENLGHLCIVKGDYSRAEECFRKLIESPAGHYQSLGRGYLAYIPMYLGKLDEALSILERGILRDREGGTTSAATADKYMLRALIFREKGDLDAAVDEMADGSKILHAKYAGDRQMTDLRNRHFQVQLLAEKGDIPSALEAADSIKICLEEFGLETAIPAYWYAIGMIEYQRGALEASIAALEKAVEIDWMNSSWTRYVLGEVLLAAEKPERAAEVLERAVKMCGTYSFTNPIFAARTHYMLGMSYEMVGESRRAIAEYEVFLEIWKDADTYLEDVPDASLRLTRLKTI